MPQVYLDCDGVLADFDAGAARILGMPPAAYQSRFGAGRFWGMLGGAGGFFEHLPLMPDAMTLYEAVRGLDPVILTGLPRGTWAEPQKRRWAERHFPGVPVITTSAALKREPLPPPCSAEIVGEADDGAGVQCLVVAIDGSTERPDGGAYHVTWSLDRQRGRRPVDSNGVIAWLGWRTVERAALTLIPGRF